MRLVCGYHTIDATVKLTRHLRSLCSQTENSQWVSIQSVQITNFYHFSPGYSPVTISESDDSTGEKSGPNGSDDKVGASGGANSGVDVLDVEVDEEADDDEHEHSFS